MSRKLAPFVFVLCLAFLLPLLVHVGHLDAYIARFTAYATPVDISLPVATSTTVDLSVDLGQLVSAYGDPISEGSAPYRISLFPHCNAYDEDWNCVDQSPDLCAYVHFTPKDGESDDVATGLMYTPYATVATGLLSRPGDEEDHWGATISSPCFQGECPSDYNSETYGEPLPQSLKGQVFRCDVQIGTNERPVLVRALGGKDALAQQVATDRVTLSAVFTGEIATSTESGCTTNCNSNILFLPGIMGSRLYEESDVCGIFGGEKERWVSSSDCDQSRLSLDEAGKSMNPLYTKEGDQGVIDDTYSFNLYQSFMHDLSEWKNDGMISDYALLPYDWRLSLEDILQNSATTTNGKLSYGTAQGFTNTYLYNTLRHLVETSRTKKVTIVAHSNGGLVAKALLSKLKETHDPLFEKIDNVIFVAVPQAGTPETIGSLLYGDDIGPGGMIISAKRVRELLHNMPFAYNLLPSAAYVGTSTPVVEFDGNLVSPLTAAYGSTIDTTAELNDYLLGGDGRVAPSYEDLSHAAIVNTGLFVGAQSVHATLDDWQPASTTEVYEIAGWGVPTIAGLRYAKNRECVLAEPSSTPAIPGEPHRVQCVGYKDTIKISDKFSIDGDGTVMRQSAELMASSTTVHKYWVDLMRYNNDGFLGSNIDRRHANIFEIDELRDQIKNIVLKNIANNNYIVDDISKLSSPASYVKYEIHSPLNMHIYDAHGNHTGIASSTGMVEHGVKGAWYHEIGDSKVIVVDAALAHRVQLEGYAPGSFTFDVEMLHGDTVATTTSFVAVPTSTSTTASFVLGPDHNIASSTLSVDFDGDLTPDVTLFALPNKEVVYDVTPPEVRVFFDPAKQDVAFAGIDNVSSTTLSLATSSALVRDSAGNTARIMFAKAKEKSAIKMLISGIEYNGVAKKIPKISLAYEWELKYGTVKTLSQELEIQDVRSIEAEYKQLSNQTKITDEGRTGTSKFLKNGLVSLTLQSNNGKFNVIY